ncbi:MAG: SDR family NAD(P)-dependent oxidoreductase [Bacteroidota bacterium]
MKLEGKNILLTGGSSGIGLEISRVLVAKGAKVMVCGRNPKRLDSAKAEIPGLLTTVCDVSDYEQIQALYHTSKERLGQIDVLINNAAVFRRFLIRDFNYSLDKQLEEIDINLNGSIRMVHAFLPDLLQRPEAVIVNLTSPSAFIPMAAAPIYSLTKAAIQSWTQSLRLQLADTKVRVVELNPPAVNTQMNADNPGVEGLKLMPPEKFARISVRGLEKERKEIMPSHAGLVKKVRRWMPNMGFKMLNRENYVP